ncbi:hypothetical protein ACFQ8W_26130 [Streptomyces sp. NPDC056508]|uniref:hypothetical protein n=1 Tax=Streptomyces sp. NPDC056508 TaxID=3345845 RepID=UPI0036B0D06A
MHEDPPGTRRRGSSPELRGAALAPGERTRLDLDFTDIAKKYAAYLANDPVQGKSQIEVVQTVNSTKGADLIAEISHADATLTTR